MSACLSSTVSKKTTRFLLLCQETYTTNNDCHTADTCLDLVVYVTQPRTDRPTMRGLSLIPLRMALLSLRLPYELCKVPHTTRTVLQKRLNTPTLKIKQNTVDFPNQLDRTKIDPLYQLFLLRYSRYRYP